MASSHPLVSCACAHTHCVPALIGYRSKLSQWGLHVASENNFPTAAGLASSASGFAALTYALATLYGLPGAYSVSELTRVARQGSGSACRSLMGGFVAWQSGEQQDGKDSLAVSVAEQEHWPTLQALICVVSDAKKGTPSTAGMQRTVATSPLLAERIKNVVPQRMEDMRKAITARDFDAFARLTMADSNNFHACCLDTQPPIFYMNDTSRAVIQLIEELNRASLAAGGKRLAGYTYDAGPNAVLYHEADQAPLILDLIRHYFPSTALDDTFNLLGQGKGASIRGPQPEVSLPEDLPEGFNSQVIPIQSVGAVSRLIHTQVGPGPQVLEQVPRDRLEPVQDNGQTGLLDVKGLPIRLQRAKRA